MPKLLIVLGVIAVGMAGIFSYLRFRPQPAAARVDPAVMVASALSVLERSEEHGLTDEQVEDVLPLLRVLRDLDPAEAEPARVLARSIMEVLTPEQRAEIERRRARAQARREPGGGPPSRAQRVGPGPSGPQAPGGVRVRGAARQRLLGRLIERLETRDEWEEPWTSDFGDR